MRRRAEPAALTTCRCPPRRVPARLPRVPRLRTCLGRRHIRGWICDHLRAGLLLLVRKPAAPLAGVQEFRRPEIGHTVPGAPLAWRGHGGARPGRRRRVAACSCGDPPDPAPVGSPGLLCCHRLLCPDHPRIHRPHRAWRRGHGGTPSAPAQPAGTPGRCAQATYMVVSPQVPRYAICTHEVELRSLFTSLAKFGPNAAYDVRGHGEPAPAPPSGPDPPPPTSRRYCCPCTTPTGWTFGWRRRRPPCLTRGTLLAAGAWTSRAPSPPAQSRTYAARARPCARVHAHAVTLAHPARADGGRHPVLTQRLASNRNVPRRASGRPVPVCRWHRDRRPGDRWRVGLHQVLLSPRAPAARGRPRRPLPLQMWKRLCVWVKGRRLWVA